MIHTQRRKAHTKKNRHMFESHDSPLYISAAECVVLWECPFVSDLQSATRLKIGYVSSKKNENIKKNIKNTDIQ